jgi:hypothetical protein
MTTKTFTLVFVSSPQSTCTFTINEQNPVRFKNNSSTFYRTKGSHQLKSGQHMPAIKTPLTFNNLFGFDIAGTTNLFNPRITFFSVPEDTPIQIHFACAAGSGNSFEIQFKGIVINNMLRNDIIFPPALNVEGVAATLKPSTFQTWPENGSPQSTPLFGTFSSTIAYQMRPTISRSRFTRSRRMMMPACEDGACIVKSSSKKLDALTKKVELLQSKHSQKDSTKDSITQENTIPVLDVVT